MKLIYAYALLILLLGIGWSYRISTTRPVVLPRDQNIKILATIKQEPRLNDRYQVLKIGDGRVYTDLFPRYRVDDKVEISGEVDKAGTIYFPQIEKVGHKRSFGAFFGDLKGRISQNFAKVLPAREATLVSGTALGLDSIDRDFKDQLIKTGTIHVVVVSGQNLSIVAGVFISLAKYIGRRQSLILATVAVFLYAALTGFEPPVVRASLMVLSSTLAVWLGREAQSLWILLLAALIIIFIWPYALFEISFQLTFAATLGIMTLGQKLSKFWSKVPFLGQNAAISTSAYLFTAPIILFYFGKVSILAPIVNVLVIETVAPVMILGFLMAIFSFIWLPIAQIVAFIAYVPAFFFTKSVEVFSILPLGQIDLGKGNYLILLTFYFLIFTLLLLWTRKKKSY